MHLHRPPITGRLRRADHARAACTRSRPSEAAKAGFDVMTEKPMATRWSDGLAMVRACDEAGARLFVVKQNRRNPTLQLLKRAVSSGRFGRLYMVNVNVFWTRPQAYYDSADWRGTWEFDGGAFMNQASHYVDLLDWIVGPVESVMAYTGTLARDIEVEDTGVAAVKWRNGAMGSINVTMLTYPKNLEGSITLLGEKGSVVIGGVAVNEIRHWEFATPDDMDGALDQASYETTSVYGFGHPLYYDNVIEVLRGDAQPETDGREGLKSLETPDRDVPLGARRQAGQSAAGVLNACTHAVAATTIHPSAIVDARARSSATAAASGTSCTSAPTRASGAAARSARTSSSATT
jgi:predicted dehydrogenase